MFGFESLVVALYSNPKCLQIYDINRRHALKTFEGHSGAVNSVCFSPDGSLILSGSDDKTIKLWETSKTVLRKSKNLSDEFEIDCSGIVKCVN